jgi:glycosyltransferase involved in cell wall biosynthesis
MKPIKHTTADSSTWAGRTQGPHKPHVSVVVPARNAAATLADTLESVLAQDFAGWELLVVDDGSCDETPDIVGRYAARDPRIVRVQGAARGVSAARNLGARAARGALLAFLDADDLWLPHKLSAHVRAFETCANLGVSFDRILFVDAQGQPTGVESTRRVHGLQAADFLHENPASTASTLVVRRAAFLASGGFDEEMACAEDLEWLLRMRCSTPWSVEGLGAVLTHYRAAPVGASSRLDAMQLGWEQMVEKVRRYAPDLVHRHYRSARAVHLRYLARRAARLDLPARRGLALFFEAVASSPVALLKDPRRTFGTLAVLVLLAARPFAPTRGA